MRREYETHRGQTTGPDVGRMDAPEEVPQMAMILVHAKTGTRVTRGAKLLSFRDERYTLASSTEPTHPGSTGRVSVVRGHVSLPAIQRAEQAMKTESYFPGVVGLEWRTE